MEQTTIAAAPYFAPEALREELSALMRANRDDHSAVRAAVLARLRQLIRHARAEARRQLELDGNGRRCAEGLSRFQDALIRLIHDFAVTHVYRVDNPSDAEHMAVVATGGYGRGMLAPGSDIDLLFLLPYKQTAWGESVVEYMLYLLWDLGLKVGHATRSVEQCIRNSEADMTIRTAILDARPILGDDSLFADLMDRFHNEIVFKSAREFIEAKLAERDARHRRAGASRYLVEPNIKDGKGGLRDLHTLHWLATYLHGGLQPSATDQVGAFTASEIMTYRRCEDFLWSARCHLHFLTGRAEERLSFDVQPVMADRLGYSARPGVRPAERFMKHYFLIAKDVGDLTGILCSALEMQQLKAAPALNRILSPLTWRTRLRIRRQTEFRIENGRLTVERPDIFAVDPVNLIRIFAQAERHNVVIHPEAVRLIRKSLRFIDDDMRADPEAGRLFLELVTSPAGAESTLRKMNEAGVLAAFIPEFRPVVCMMQFNMYHHFTVDEHLFRTLGVLGDIEAGKSAADLPLSTEIIKTLPNRRALYVAALLHDVGKGRKADHSVLGAGIARTVCPRLGLTPAETETVVWLVEHHLDMSNIAQSRDLNDPKTIRSFADVVQSPDRLKLLLLLTVADIRAVGPGTWNGWKGQLLRTLYWETEPLVAGGHTQLGHRERIAAAQDALRQALADWAKDDVEQFISRHYPDYWLKTETGKQVEHARLMRSAQAEGSTFATHFSTNAFHAVSELTVMAPNSARLLAQFAGACAAAGANIVGAHVSTTRDNVALDTFLLARDLPEEADERRRAARIGQSIEKLVAGEVKLEELMARRREAKARNSVFTVEPEVLLTNTQSDRLTVIEIAGLDRPGLLHDLTSTLSDLNLDIASAHITTFGEKAVDVFYVTDLAGKQVTSEARQRQIRERLLAALAVKKSGTAVAPAAAAPG